MTNEKTPKIFKSNVLEFYRAQLRGTAPGINNFVAKFGKDKANELEFFIDTYVEMISCDKFRLGDVLPKKFKDTMLSEDKTENFLSFLKGQKFKFYVKGEKDEGPEVEVKPVTPKKPSTPAKPVRQAPPSVKGLNEQATKEAQGKVASKAPAVAPSPDADDFMSDAEDNVPLFKDFTGLCELAAKFGAKFILSKSLVAGYQTTTESVKVSYDENVLRQLGMQIADPYPATSKDGAKMNLGFKKLAVAYGKFPVIQYATKTVYAQGTPHMEQLALLIDRSKVADFEKEFAISFDFKVSHQKLADTKVLSLLSNFNITRQGVEYEVCGFKLANVPFMDEERTTHFTKLPMANIYSAVFKLHLVNQLKKLGKEAIKVQDSEVEKIKGLHPAYKDKFSVPELEAKGIDPSTMAISFEDPTIYMTVEEAEEHAAEKAANTQAPQQVYVGIDLIFPRIHGKINLTGKKLLDGGEEYITAVGLLDQVCLPKDRKTFETFKKTCADIQKTTGTQLSPEHRAKLEKAIKTFEARESGYKKFLHFKKATAFTNDDLSMGGVFTSDGKISRGNYTYLAQVNTPLGKTHYKELGFKLKGN